VSSSGAQGNGNSGEVAISGDGRYVAFSSEASNLVAGDTNNVSDVFVRDVVSRTTTRASIATNGAQANGGSEEPAISGDGRYVVFESYASNLVPGDTNTGQEVFVRDLATSATTRVSLEDSFDPAISADGRYIAFVSDATNLVPGDTNNTTDVFVWDSTLGTTARVTLASGGGQANDSSYHPVISAHGRYVAFESGASNLVAADTSNSPDVFVRDTVAGSTALVSVAATGAQPNADSYHPEISADGRYITFYSHSSNLVPGDTNDCEDVFVRDTATGTTTRVSVDSTGGQGDDYSYESAISGDGRYVTFWSFASNLVPSPSNEVDVYVRDTVTGTTARVGLDATGVDANASDVRPSISADGRYIAFESYASNLVPGDTNNAIDVVVRANPVVTVSGIAPSSAPRGAPRNVTITGRNFRPGVIVNAGNDVTLSSVVLVNETTVTAKLTPAPGAATGARNVIVAAPGTGPGWLAGSAGLCSGCLTIT